MSVEATAGSGMVSALRQRPPAGGIENKDQHPRRQEAVEAEKRRRERMRRLGPPAPSAGEKGIAARATGSRRPTSQVSPVDDSSQGESPAARRRKTGNSRIHDIQKLTAETARRRQAAGQNRKGKAKPATSWRSRKHGGRAVPAATAGKSRNSATRSTKPKATQAGKATP